MRQLAILPPSRAHLLADYLLTLQIDTQLERLESDVAVWVCDEDKLASARTELEAFLAEPTQPRYAQARPEAARLRELQQEDEEDPIEDDEEDESDEGITRITITLAPLTLLFGLACVLVFLQAAPGDSSAADYDPGPTYDLLALNSDATAQDGFLADVRRGQVWRVFTPALLHLGPLHLVFNVVLLIYLGTILERSIGPLRVLLLFLLLAASSNLAQGAIVGPYFGGASGVIYGIIGYLWIKDWRQPELGLSLPPGVIAFALAWLVFCWITALFPEDLRQRVLGSSAGVANIAHTVGLLAGMALALLPTEPVEQAPDPVPEDEAP